VDFELVNNYSNSLKSKLPEMSRHPHKSSASIPMTPSINVMSKSGGANLLLPVASGSKQQRQLKRRFIHHFTNKVSFGYSGIEDYIQNSLTRISNNQEEDLESEREKIRTERASRKKQQFIDTMNIIQEWKQFKNKDIKRPTWSYIVKVTSCLTL